VKVLKSLLSVSLLKASLLRASLLKASLLRASLLSSIGLIASLWVCTVNAQVAITTTILKQQVVAPLANGEPAPASDIQGFNSTLTGVIVEPSYEWVDAALAAPGDKLRYTLQVQNDGQYTVPKGHLRIEDKVPQGSILAPETLLQANRLTAFSVSADGQYFVAAASAVGPAEGWRWLRWEYLKPLAPGQSFNLSFQTRLQGEVGPQAESQGASASVFSEF
jgi:uncharacterized repeat protein (TIGR01451 family)